MTQIFSWDICVAVLQRGLAFEGVRCLFSVVALNFPLGSETSFECKWLEKVDLNAFAVNEGLNLYISNIILCQNIDPLCPSVGFVLMIFFAKAG